MCNVLFQIIYEFTWTCKFEMVPPLHPPQKKMATCSFHYFHSKLLHLACFVQRNIYKWASVKGWRAGFWEGFPQRLALFGEPINYIKRQTSSIRRSNFRRRYPEVSNHILVGNISCCIVLLQFQIQQVSKIASNLSQLEPTWTQKLSFQSEEFLPNHFSIPRFGTLWMKSYQFWWCWWWW